MSGKILYYISEYTDESMPCEPALEAWAEWLNKCPDFQEGLRTGAWDSEGPADHIESGRLFRAEVIEMAADIVVQRKDGQLVHTLNPPEDATFFAVRYGNGLGWDPDSISYDLEGALDYLKEGAGCEGDIDYIAVGVSLPAVNIKFERTKNGPVCSVIGSAEGQCRKCGCTDSDCSQCIERTGQPCYWLEEDLCSACEAEDAQG